MDRWDWFCVSGSLAPYAAGYERWLVDRGFAPLALPSRMRQLDHLSRWLEREGLSAGQLTPQRIEQYLAARRAAGYVTWVSELSMRLPLAYLRGVGVVPAARPAGRGRPAAGQLRSRAKDRWPRLRDLVAACAARAARW